MQFSFMPQADERVLADDDRGKIVYKERAFDLARCATWFAQLRDGVAWRSERRMMYDRMIDVPRLVASYPLDEPGVPEPILEMRPTVERFCAVTFTSAGLNFYRDGNDSVAPHGDHVERGPQNAPVLLVSLGAVRRMTIRSRFKPRRVLDLDLAAGSMLLMSYETHFNYDHAVPKTKDLVGPRISVAFRQSMM